MKIKDTEIRYLKIEDIEFRATDNKKPKKIKGYAMKWNELSEDLGGFIEKFTPGSFAKSIRKSNQLSYFNHNHDIILGSTNSKTLELVEDDVGLRFSIELPDTTAGNDVGYLIKRGDVKGVSIGFNVPEEGENWDMSGIENGKPAIRTVTEANLIEISPTPRPAFPQTWVIARSTEKQNNELQKIKNKVARNKQLRENLLKNKGVNV
jgi:HK97 family phage prohead protease